MLIVRSEVPLRQPEDGQYMPKYVVVHYTVIKYTPCDKVLFDYIQFSKFHTHNGDDTLPRFNNFCFFTSSVPASATVRTFYSSHAADLSAQYLCE